MYLSDKVSLSLKLEATFSAIGVISCFIFLILNYIYITKSRQSVFSDSLCFVAVLSTFCGFLTNFWFAFGYQNWIHVNDNCVLLSFILNHCDIGFRLTFVCVILQIYGFAIFILSQIKTLLHHLPLKYQIKSKTYFLSVIILIFVAFIFCLFLMYDRQLLHIGLLKAKDNIKYTYCFPFHVNQFIIFILITWSCMAITVVSIFIRAFRSNLRIKRVLIDANICEYNKIEIKRLLYDILKFISFFVVCFTIEISIFPACTIFPACISIIISSIIASNLHRNYKHNIREYNQFKYINQQLQLSILNIGTTIQSNSITIHSNSTHNTSLTLDTFELESNKQNYTCDLVYKYQNGLQLMVADEFINDAKRIFTTLNDLFYDEFGSGIYHILQEIAAFAATQLEPCMDCGIDLPLIECDKDYNMEYGVVSMVDQYNNTRYYINQDNLDQIEVLCRLCATKRGVLSNFLLLPTLSRTFQILRAEKQ